jgi:hypothetical protein
MRFDAVVLSAAQRLLLLLAVVAIKVLMVVTAAFVITGENAAIILIVAVFLVSKLLHPLCFILIKQALTCVSLLKDLVMLLFLFIFLDDNIILRSVSHHYRLLYMSLLLLLQLH